MHFPIICIEEMSTPRKDWVNVLPYDDRTLNEHTDYYGEMYSPSERLEVIRSHWFKTLFEGYATIDAKKQTITFFDRETVERRFKDYLLNVTEELYEKAKCHNLRAYELRLAGSEYKGYYILFYKDYGQTSFDFIDDAKYMAGQTYRIGNIFDAHI